MRKTKKEKIEARARRERFLYSLSAIQKAPKKEGGKETEEEKLIPIASQPQSAPENFSYLGGDLRKIAILALLAFFVQIVLYLTIF
jgi:preprotein translocase subunit SecF